MRTLVAGIGNIFNRDDGFGVEVARTLLERPVPAGVRVEDFGIRGVHLALELLDGYDLLVMIDVMPCGGPPGTLVLVEPDPDEATGAPLDAHRTDPNVVLGMVAEMGGRIGRVLVVGCQPADLSEGMGLTSAVAAAVAPAVRMIEDLLEERNVPCSVDSSSSSASQP
jgi:hydrogenase maturation protease